jgi:CHASE3 domain sensor protein
MAEDSIKLAILEQKLLDFGNIINKLDSAIEKISEVNSNITKMLAVHEERIEHCNKSDDLITKLIDDLRNENKEQHEEVSKRIDKVEEKLQDVSRIKWMTVGTGIVLAVLATAFSSLASGWWTPSEPHIIREPHIRHQITP